MEFIQNIKNPLALNDPNINIIFDLSILNEEQNIKIKQESFIGKGTYGDVYYIGKISNIDCIIKICKSISNKNQYEQDAYFYRKYHSENKGNLINIMNSSLPFLLNLGKTKNKIDGLFYDYLIIEYVGVNNLYNALKTKVVDFEEKLVYKLIFYCIYNHLLSFHQKNLIYRDVSPGNIVISDKITSLFMNKSYRFNDNLNDKLINIIPKNIGLKDILQDFIDGSYSSLIKFVDGGLFGDFDYIYNTDKYDKKSLLFLGIYDEFNLLDGMFSSTLLYISPFCMFNLSSIINIYDDQILTQNIKNMIFNILKLSDIWNLLIFYTIHLHDTNGVSNIYQVYAKGRQKRNPLNFSKYDNGTNENTLLNMPFYINKNNEVKLVKELEMTLNSMTQIINKEYFDIRNKIAMMINEIISFVNLLLSRSNKETVRYYINFDKEFVQKLLDESTQKLNYINSIMNSYRDSLKNEIIEYCQNN